MNLHDLQAQFMGYLLDESQGKSSGFEVGVRRGLSTQGPSEGLAIYARAYRSRLIDVLGSDHAKLCAYLGTARFEQLASHYVAAHPSSYRSLRWFGQDFPAFLTRNAGAEAATAGELAAFERLLLDVYDAKSVQQPEYDVLAQVDVANWPLLTFEFHPSVRPFAECQGAVRIWQHFNGADAAADQPGADAPIEPGLEQWLLWRDRTRVCRFKHIDPAEHRLFQAIYTERLPFAQAAETLIDLVPGDDLAPRLHGYLRHWFADGLIAAIATGS